MKESLKKIEKLIAEAEIDVDKIRERYIYFIKKELKDQHRINNYIGDYPTFIEPVHLGNNVKIGDDVLLGPNVYIGNNCEIGNYTEIINSILFDDIILGNNFKLENCIISKNSKLTFNNFRAFSCILMGETDSGKNLKKFSF